MQYNMFLMILVFVDKTFGILQNVFEDTYSHWRGFGVARTQKMVGFALFEDRKHIVEHYRGKIALL